jgi:hypothetical protein
MREHQPKDGSHCCRSRDPHGGGEDREGTVEGEIDMKTLPSTCRRTQQQKDAIVKSAKKQTTMERAPTGGELIANRTQHHLWWMVAVMLIILWLPGPLSGYTAGGAIHILLPLALVAVLFRIIRGRRPA